MINDTSNQHGHAAPAHLEPMRGVDSAAALDTAVVRGAAVGGTVANGNAMRGFPMRGFSMHGNRALEMNPSACAIDADKRGRTETGAHWLHTPEFGTTHHFQRWRPAT